MPRTVLALLTAALFAGAAAPAAHAQSGDRGWWDDDPSGYTDPTYVDPETEDGSDWDGTDGVPVQTVPAPVPTTTVVTVPTTTATPAPYDDDPYAEDPYDDEPVVTTPEPAPLPALPTTGLTVVKGKLARLRTDGKAAIPHDAPKAVRTVIRAANQIIGKPYKWGGGHAKVFDTGYDCSGSVSYALIRAGLLTSPLVSGTFARTYAAGAGRHLSIYANKGHVYMEIAGLRLDTSSVGDWGGKSGVRWRPIIGKRKGFASRHVVGL